MRIAPRIAGVLLFSMSATLVGLGLAAVTAQADTGCPTASGSYGGGAGTGGDPYLISEPGHLQLLRNTTADYSKSFLFTTDINMGGCVWSAPIADGGSTFTGLLDGDGHVINGLSVNLVNPPTAYAGLIGYLGTNGTIRDLGFTGSVSMTQTGPDNFAYVGGLVGFTFAPTSITGSYATGDVSASITTNQTSVTVIVGGLVAYNQSTVSNSYATGDVTAAGTSTAGGGSSASVRAGGAFGSLSMGDVSNVYATGVPTGNGSAGTVTRWVGGFAGDRGTPTLSGLFWDTTTSGTSSATGFGASTSITGKATTDMQSVSPYQTAGWTIAAGYDATSTWGVCARANGGYPFLTAFYSSSPCAASSDPSQIPPTWYQSIGRLSPEDGCESGWSPSWAHWMNAGQGGFVCNREIYWDIRTSNWATR